MASVSKLLLMPINMWHRLSKDRKDIDVQSMKTIEISSVHQSGTGNVPPLNPSAMLEGPVVGQALSPSPPSPPPLPPRRRKEKREGGRGTPKHIDREDTSKEKTLIEMERDVGVWRLPGKVIPNKKSAIKCKWIHI